MASYIQLLTLTPEGRERVLKDPGCVLRAQQAVKRRDVEVLGLYAVLGEFDFVSIVDAPNNEAVARFSIELGVLAMVHITTLPAVPVAQLEEWPRDPLDESEVGVEESPPEALDLRGA